MRGSTMGTMPTVTYWISPSKQPPANVATLVKIIMLMTWSDEVNVLLSCHILDLLVEKEIWW